RSGARDERGDGKGKLAGRIGNGRASRSARRHQRRSRRGPSTARHASSLRAYEYDAFAGLVDGSRTDSSAPISGGSVGSTRRRQSSQAIVPLSATKRIFRCVAKNVRKSLMIIVDGTIDESRLPRRSPAASTSHSAMPDERRRSSLSA